MPDKKLKILFIHDNAGDVDLIRLLHDQGERLDLAHSSQSRVDIDRLRSGEFDACLLDLDHLDGPGDAILELLRKQAGTIPIVVLAGGLQASRNIGALQLDLRDGLVRDRGDVETIIRALSSAVEHRKTERALRESEEQLKREQGDRAREKNERELTANLLMIAETTANTLDIDKLMKQIALCGSRLLGCDACVTYLWDRDRKTFQPSQHHGLDHELVPLFRMEALDEKFGFVQRMLELKRPVMVRFSAPEEATCLSSIASLFMPAQDVDEGPLATRTALWMNDNMRVLVVIPLFGKTSRLGLIITVYRDLRTFTERDLTIVKSLSRRASLALGEAHTYRTAVERSLELNHKLETLQVIHEIDLGILSCLEPPELLEKTMRNISRIVPCDMADVALVDRERQGFILTTGKGSPSSPHKPFVPFCDTSATDVIKTARPQYTGNIKRQKNLLPEEQKLLQAGFVSHIRVPLMVKGAPVGFLSVDSRRMAAFTPENVVTLEKLAALIGIALGNTRLVTDLKELFHGTVKSLSNAIDAKSPWTAGHSERVTHYALLIGKEMNIQDDDLKDLQLGGLLHDVGKIGIYDTILNKPGTLSKDEYEIVKRHPLRGVGLLEPIKQLNRVIPCVRHHHERYDGAGYPDGLRGDAIPLWARILAVADAFESMTVNRPYRKALDTERAMEELNRCSVTQFDPEVVKVFLDLIAKNNVTAPWQPPSLSPDTMIN